MQLALNFPDGAIVNNPPGLKFSGTATLGDIISAFLPYLFDIAGLILFAMLVFGGFQFITSSGDPKATDSAKSRITNAVIGFIIIFVTYWLIQIVEVVFHLSII